MHVLHNYAKSSEYTKNTRSGNMTSTGHDRQPYKRLTQQSGLRSTGSVSEAPTPAVLGPPPGLYFCLHLWSRSVLIQLPKQYQNNIMVVGYSLTERVTIFLYLTVHEHNWVLHAIHFKNLSGFLHIYTRKVFLPHSKYCY